MSEQDKFKSAAHSFDNQNPPEYYEKTIDCEACEGTEFNPGTEHQCIRCDGKGELTFDTRTNLRKNEDE